MARILVVEDEQVAAECILDFLADSEYEVIAIVASGAAALQQIPLTRPDLILMDIHLSGAMDGIATAQAISAQWDLPIVFLTAIRDDETLRRAIATSPFGYLLKPFDALQLHTTINIALRRRLLETQLQQAEQWLAAVLTSIGEGTIATDPLGHITFINPVAVTLTGWSQTAALGQPITQVLNVAHLLSRRPAANPLLEAIQQGRSLTQTDGCLLVTRTGQEYIIGCVASPIKNQQGEITGGVIVFQDISQRKREERLLHRREQEFRALVEHSPDIIARFDHQLRYRYINPSMERITGLPAQAFQGRTNQELGMPASVLTTWDTQLRQVFATAQETTITFELLTIEGPRIYQARLVPEFATDHRVRSVLSVARDITQHHQTELSLRRQAERERLLGVLLQRIRQSLDLQTLFTTAVAEIGTLLQLERAEIVQYRPRQQLWCHVASYRHNQTLPDTLGLEVPDAANPFATPLRRAALVCIDGSNREGDPANPDLMQFPITAYPGAWLLVPLCVGDAHSVRVGSSSEDGTDNQVWGSLNLNRLQSPCHWEESDVELARAIADQLAIAIQQSELYQQVQHLNSDLEQQVLERTVLLRQAFTFEATLKRITDRVRDSLDENQILQTAVEELAQAIGVSNCNASIYNLEQQTSTIRYQYATSVTPFRNTVLHMANFDQGYAQLLQGQYFQFCSCRPHPEEGPVAKLACPILDNAGVLGDLWLIHRADYGFSEQDIRLVQQVANQCAIALRQSRLYQAAQSQVTELERLNRLKDDFLSTVSHELRTPLSNIKMAIQMLEIVLKPLGILAPETGPAHRYFQILQQECQRETSLIGDLLDLSRLEAGEETLTIVTLEPTTWLEQMIVPFMRRFEAQQQSLVLDIPPDLPSIQTDATYLGRILNELLNNACKYTPAGETIRVFARLEPEVLHFGVSNSGVDIPPMELPHIFDKFYRILRHDPWQHGGTGLGLALIHRLVSQLEGTITVESQGGLTTFTVSLPRLETPSEINR